MSEIFDCINQEKLSVVLNSIDKAHGLTNECYLDGQYNIIERKKVFENNWVVIGIASSISNIGDVKPANLLGIPLIMLKDKENKIRVFHNVCSHRRYKLVSEECNLKYVLRCPYHSWSYDFSGNFSPVLDNPTHNFAKWVAEMLIKII